jgi:dipeptidyl aminopeptidase/acylaminoacyl peptidase
MLAAEHTVAAVVALYPPARLAPGVEGDTASLLLGPGASPEAFRQASPLNQVRAGFPPTLLIHGDADDLVPAQDSIDLYQRLRELGSAAELHVFSGAPHAFDVDPDYGRQCLQLIALFLEKRVVRAPT